MFDPHWFNKKKTDFSQVSAPCQWKLHRTSLCIISQGCQEPPLVSWSRAKAYGNRSNSNKRIHKLQVVPFFPQLQWNIPSINALGCDKLLQREHTTWGKTMEILTALTMAINHKWNAHSHDKIDRRYMWRTGFWSILQTEAHVHLCYFKTYYICKTRNTCLKKCK